MSKIKQVIKRSGALVAFTPERITNAIYRAQIAVGDRNLEQAQNISTLVVQDLENQYDQSHIPTIEEIQDTVEKILIQKGYVKVAKAYILYRKERAEKRQQRAELASRPSVNIPWAKIWHILDWAVDQGLNTTTNLNLRLQKGEIEDIIRASEQAYEVDLENAAEMISLHLDTLRMVLISGPSSSGKTTTTIKLGQRLKHIGIKLTSLNVDNYFFNLDMHPKDEFGDYDFETPYALDLELINKHLSELIAGHEVQIPFYDFKTGMRTSKLTPMHLEENELVLIDSLHGLYPDMTKSINDEQKFRLFLEPLLQMKTSYGEFIRWTDIRLMRRMLRDASHRSYDPTKTLMHWHYVRSSEMRNIIPFISNVDYIINSAMPYELGYYKPKLIADFQKWVQEFEFDPLKTDAYFRAKRSLKVLEDINATEDEKLIPGDSVIREFIGGSSLTY